MGCELMIVNLSNPKTSKSYSVKTESPVFIGRKLNELVDLGVLNLKAKGQIMGGSSKGGFPMVSFVSGSVKRKALLTDGSAFKARFKGEKRRKTVFGDTVGDATEQVNIKITEIDPSVNLDALYPKIEKKK